MKQKRLYSFFNIHNLLEESKKNLFLTSIVLGIMLWFFFLLTTPVKIIRPLSNQVLIFITLNYLVFVSGYFFYKKRKKKSLFKRALKKENINIFLYFIIIIVIMSFFFRFFDLFHLRELSFYNSIGQNKINAAKEENFSLLIGLFSVFRFLYFVPYIFYKLSEKNNKKLLLICLLLFLIPVTEGFLRGSRRLILEPVLILGISIIVQNKRFKIDIKRVLLLISIAVFLIFGSQYILKERISEKSVKYYKRVIKAPYNDLLPLNDKTKNYLSSDTDNRIKDGLLFYCHVGQYITHGVFEFDHVIRQKPTHTAKYGLYNLYIIVKMFNKLGVSNIPLNTLKNPTKRETYITFFGGLYVDFKWLSLGIMFLFGVIQKAVFSEEISNPYLKPVVVMFILCNIMLLVFNFLRAQIFITLLVYLLAMIFFKVYLLARKMVKN
ncbi:MAG: O-antigen polysaccharide polymerase Wzy [Flavobacteriaceae bacterium]|nr:MAG: O-antigen polysaccharide polymerase Wzy [Flavobacteriaceae bacterium]